MENFPIQDPTMALTEVSALCSELQSMMSNAKAESTLYAVNSILANAVKMLDCYKGLDASSRRSSQSLADIPMQLMPQVWRTRQQDELRHTSRKSAVEPASPNSPEGLMAASARAEDLVPGSSSPRNTLTLLGWSQDEVSWRSTRVPPTLQLP